MSKTTTDRAAQILTDATTIATLITPALRHLDQSSAGLPEHTPGASPATPAGARECPHDECDNTQPCPVHDPDGDQQLTPTERLATQRDKAQHDLEQLAGHIAEAARHTARAARLALRWGLAGITDTDVKTSLATVRRDIWCDNCSRYGHKNPRLEDRKECDYCADFRRTYNRPAPPEILAIRAFRTVFPQDEQRVLNQIDPGWRKKLKKAGKAA